MRRIRLTATEEVHVEHLFKTTPERRLRDRCQAVLMASRGRKRAAIAQHTSRTHSHNPLNLLSILFIGHIALKNN